MDEETMDLIVNDNKAVVTSLEDGSPAQSFRSIEDAFNAAINLSEEEGCTYGVYRLDGVVWAKTEAQIMKVDE